LNESNLKIELGTQQKEVEQGFEAGKPVEGIWLNDRDAIVRQIDCDEIRRALTKVCVLQQTDGIVRDVPFILRCIVSLKFIKHE
jgi:hypothetical protein